MDEIDNCMRDALARALDARKVAIFGASDTPGKMGHEVVRQLLAGGYADELALVNRRGGKVCGIQSSRDPVVATGSDVAVLAVPAEHSIELIDHCGALGIGMAVVCAGGFGESGNHARHKELVRAARKANVTIMGPNCVGFHASPRRLNLTTLPHLPRGSVSCVLQSGGVSFHVAQRLLRLRSGFDVLLNLGNKGGIDFTVALEAVAERQETASVLIYMEQFDEGDRFLRALESVSRDLPVVILVGGTSVAGSMSARSHTGAVLAPWDRAVGTLRDCGAYIATTIDEAVAAAVAGRRGAVPRRRKSLPRVFVLSDGGGLATLNCDALSRFEFSLPAPSRTLSALLRSLADSDRLRVANPLDFGGLADNDAMLFARAFEHVLGSREYDAVLIAGALGTYRMLYGQAAGDKESEAATRIAALAKNSVVATAAQLTDADQNAIPVATFREAGIPCFESPELAAAALAIRFSTGVAASGVPRPTRSRVHDDGWNRDLARQTERLTLAFDAYSIPHALGRIVTRNDLRTMPTGRYVLRADGFPHKVSAGAIKIDIDNSGLLAAFDELEEASIAAGGDVCIRAAPFVEHDAELLLTLWRSDQHGKGCVLGTGGSLVEIAADIQAGRFPVSRDDVLSLLRRSRAGKRLLARGGASIDEFVRVVLAIARVFDGPLQDLAELEINPLAITRDSVVVLDVLPT